MALSQEDEDRLEADNPAMTIPVSQLLTRTRSSATANGDGRSRGWFERGRGQLDGSSGDGGSVASSALHPALRQWNTTGGSVGRRWSRSHDKSNGMGTMGANTSTKQANESTPAATEPPNTATDSTVSATATATASASASTPSPFTKHDKGWRRITRNFSPSWFAVTMGTGIVSELLINIPLAFPSQYHWLYWVSVAFFILNAILFSVATIITVLRYTLYPEIWGVMIRDPTNSLFLGTIPMGFATLVSAWTSLCCPYWGHWSVLVAWGAWMLDCVVAVAVTVALPFLLMSESHQQSLERITAAQLLPIASTIVASGTGVNVAGELAGTMGVGEEGRALGTLIACYVLWGMATPMALTVLVIYYQRLALHKLPSREIIVSSFLPLGPLGMGGYAIMRCGAVARTVFPATGFLGAAGGLAGDVVYVLGLFVALIMWGFGLVWLVFALAAIIGVGKFPFNMGWWGFTFPLGVYSLSTMHFGIEMPSLFFKVLGTIFAVAVVLLWVVVAAGTARGAWRGHLFYAPCLRNLEPREDTTLQQEKDTESNGNG